MQQANRVMCCLVRPLIALLACLSSLDRQFGDLRPLTGLRNPRFSLGLPDMVEAVADVPGRPESERCPTSRPQSRSLPAWNLG